MPSSETPVTIRNAALDIIGEYPISTVNDDNVYARFMNRNLPRIVEGALREQPWNFAIEFHELHTEPSAPAFRWRYRYGLPPGWLRVLTPTLDGYRTSRALAYEVKGNKLYMNDIGPRPVEIVMNVQNPGEWDPLFVQLIAARLANAMAHRFTGKASFVEMTARLAAQAFDTAEEVNSFEGTLNTVEQHDIIRVRGDWGSFSRGYDR